MTKTIWAAIAAFFILSLAVKPAHADDSYIMKTDEGGFLLLTGEACELGDKDGYGFMAYAFHVGDQTYKGCWKDLGQGVAVVFPDDPAQYVFAKKLFQPGKYDQVEK